MTEAVAETAPPDSTTDISRGLDLLLRLFEAAMVGEDHITLQRTPELEFMFRGASAPSMLSKKTMTPYEAVREQFEFPFELYPFQIEEVNRLAEGDQEIYLYDGPKGDQGAGDVSGHYDEPGTGKTAISTHVALYRSMRHGVQQWVALMPPILVPQWGAWLRSVKRRSNGMPLTATEYVGQPAQRRKLPLSNNFLLMSYQMFKNDFERLWAALEGRKVGGLADEGHAMKNHTTANHKAFFQFFEGRDKQILTGTPLTKPGDAFGYCRLIAPGRYRNHRHFEQLHAGQRDAYDRVISWENLDVLAESMKINSSRILRREVRSELPPVQFTPMIYDLEPAHLKLYQQLADEQLVEFENGREINAINQSALYSALQQIVINWPYYADDYTKQPAVLNLIETIFDEIGPTAKLAIAAHFRRSNQYLLENLSQYGTVAVFGGMTPRQRDDALDRFKNDPTCRSILLQPTSAGFGVDGLQHVCSDMLIVEAPTTAPPFHQVVARLDRDGQVNPVNCRIAIARKTVQVKMFNNLLANDQEINKVQRGYEDLRDAILGREPAVA